MNKPLLTIAMPSFNHHDDLRKQLESIIPQLNDLVHFIVLDNCSEPSVISSFSTIFKDNPSVKVIQHPTNIGLDANIQKCFEICETEWLWVLSNNDHVTKDALSIILDTIVNNKNTVFINWGYPENCQHSIKGFYEFCKYADYGYSFAISFCLYNMTKLNKYLDFYSQTIFTNQPQLLFVLKYLKDHKDETCYFTDINVFHHLTPSGWDKKSYILNTLSIYDIIDKEDLVFFKETLGRQVVYVLWHHLIISRVYESLGIRDYINIFFKILKKGKTSDLLKNRRLIVLYMICCFFPKVIYKYRKKKFLPHMDYEKNDVHK